MLGARGRLRGCCLLWGTRWRQINRLRALGDEHAITIAKEFVALGHRVLICGNGVLKAGKRAHQHDQSRLRQVEIGNQGIDHLIVIARVDKDRGVVMEGADLLGQALGLGIGGSAF